MQQETKQVSQTGSEPVTDSYLKNYIRVDFTTDDAIITSVNTAARLLVEQYLGTKLLSTTLKTYFYDFEEWDEKNGYYTLVLPFFPVTSVDAVKKVAADGSETVTTDYNVTGLDEKRISIAQTFSLTNPDGIGYIVEYTAERTTIEEPIKEAIAKLAGELYENRQNSAVDITVTSLPYDVRRLLLPYKKTFI